MVGRIQEIQQLELLGFPDFNFSFIAIVLKCQTTELKFKFMLRLAGFKKFNN